MGAVPLLTVLTPPPYPTRRGVIRVGRKVLGIAVAMLFVVGSVQVWGHGTNGQCIAGTNIEIEHGEGSCNDYIEADCLDNDVVDISTKCHIHINKRNGKEVSRSYWTKNGACYAEKWADEDFVKCGSTPPPDRSPSSTEDNNRNRNTDYNTNNGGSGNTGSRESSTSSSTIQDTFDGIVTSSSRSSSTTRHYGLDQYVSEPEPEVEPEPEPVVLEKHEWNLFEGYTLIGFPIQVFDDEHGDYRSEVEDFYHDSNIFDSSAEGIFFHIKTEGIFQQWWFYQGQGLLANFPTAGNYGVIVKLDKAESIELEGIANYPRRPVSIRVGWNLIGLPEVPSAYQLPSDFLSDAICVVIVTDETGFRSISRAGDPGDKPLYAGQGILLNSFTELTLDLSSSIASAPQAQRRGTLAVGWGAMKN